MLRHITQQGQEALPGASHIHPQALAKPLTSTHQNLSQKESPAEAGQSIKLT